MTPPSPEPPAAVPEPPTHPEPLPPLPDPLPDDPFPMLGEWLAEAQRRHRNAASMALATVDPDGRPSVRMVICRGVDARAGWLVFYTDRESRKGRALDAHARAALVFHWELLERQVRVEGPVTRASDADSDRYWDTRPLEARLAAVASDQSRPLASRQHFLDRIAQARARLGTAPPRPPRWGGYRIWAEQVELWVGQPARAHDRAVWTRALEASADGFAGGDWRATRLQP